LSGTLVNATFPTLAGLYCYLIASGLSVGLEGFIYGFDLGVAFGLKRFGL